MTPSFNNSILIGIEILCILLQEDLAKQLTIDPPQYVPI